MSSNIQSDGTSSHISKACGSNIGLDGCSCTPSNFKNCTKNLKNFNFESSQNLALNTQCLIPACILWLPRKAKKEETDNNVDKKIISTTKNILTWDPYSS